MSFLAVAVDCLHSIASRSWWKFAEAVISCREVMCSGGRVKRLLVSNNMLGSGNTKRAGLVGHRADKFAPPPVRTLTVRSRNATAPVASATSFYLAVVIAIGSSLAGVKPRTSNNIPFKIAFRVLIHDDPPAARLAAFRQRKR